MPAIPVPISASQLNRSCRILGVDPGSNCTGFALICWKNGKSTLEQAATIRVKGRLSDRLLELYTELAKVLEMLKPEEVAFEKVFTAYNPQSALKLGQARGALMLAVAQTGIPLYEYTATRVKLATVGYGRASKEEVQRMIQLEFKLPKALPSDAADAAAIALTHVVMRGNPVEMGEART